MRCYCGHLRDEHLRVQNTGGRYGYGDCEVPLCPCLVYEEA